MSAWGSLGFRAIGTTQRRQDRASNLHDGDSGNDRLRGDRGHDHIRGGPGNASQSGPQQQPSAANVRGRRSPWALVREITAFWGRYVSEASASITPASARRSSRQRRIPGRPRA